MDFDENALDSDDSHSDGNDDGGDGDFAIYRVVYRDVMTASRRHDTTGCDGPLCHDTIGSA